MTLKNKKTLGRTWKRDRLLTGLTFVHASLLFAPLLVLPYALIGITDERMTRQFFLAALLLLPAVLSWLAVRYLEALWMYALSAAVFALLAWAVLKEPVFTALGVFFFLVRGSVRIKKGRIQKEYMDLPLGENAVPVPELADIPMFLDRPSPVHLILFLICYLISLPLGAEILYRFIFWILCADIVVCFLFRYLDSFYEYVEEHQGIASLPVRTMKKIVLLLLAPALVILALAMAPAVLYGEEPLTRIRFQTEWNAGQPQEPQQISETSPLTQEMLSELTGGETREMPQWVQFLFQALLWVILAAAAVFLILAVFRAVRSMSGAFLKEEEDEITFLGEEESEERMFTGRKEKTSRFFLSPSGRIRKKFKKSALTAMKREKRRISGTETPGELEKAMKSARIFGQDEEAGLLRHMYEKARYSRESCSGPEAELVERIREIRRKKE